MPDTALALWPMVVTPRVAGTPWAGPGRYDAANFLMVPLHAVFTSRYEEGMLAFADHARRFLESRDLVRLDPATELSWLQYLYLLSRFTALAADQGRVDLVPAGLPGALRGWIEQLWQRHPAWAYSGGPFVGGVRERVLWKLGGGGARRPRRSYERAILDSELFLFAIAADLRSHARRTGASPATDPFLEDVGRVARRVFQQRVVKAAGGGWTFQPGFWDDHPDFLRACHKDKLAGLSPCASIRVAEDVSHSHRLPLWLRSLAGGEADGSSRRARYLDLLAGLEAQFFGQVVVAPDTAFVAWRTRNFMDGGNGIYRWEYRSLGPSQGYGPFELSGTLLFGWWGFLPGPRSRRLYEDLANRFPLAGNVLLVYAGPSRLGASPAGRPAAYLTDGTAELLCRLASVIE